MEQHADWRHAHDAAASLAVVDRRFADPGIVAQGLNAGSSWGTQRKQLFMSYQPAVKTAISSQAPCSPWVCNQRTYALWITLGG